MSDQTQQSNQLDMTQQTETESSAMTQKLPWPAPSTMANEPDRPQLECASVDDFQQTEISRLLETANTLGFYSFDTELSARSRRALANNNYRGWGKGEVSVRSLPS